MTIINISIPFGLIKDVQDYSNVVNDILKHDVSLNIIKFSTSSKGINLLLDLPDEKIKIITESLRKNNIVVNNKGRIRYDKDLCINCGACISLCPVNALIYRDDYSISFEENKCIACLLCINSCPRKALLEN